MRRFRRTGVRYSFSLTNFDTLDPAETVHYLEEIFERIIMQALQDTGIQPDQALIGFSLYQDQLKSPIWLPFALRGAAPHMINGRRITDRIVNTLQSYESIIIGVGMLVHIDIVSLPEDGGINEGIGTRMNFSGFLAKKTARGHSSLIKIKNKNDNLCFARALVTAFAMQNKSEQWRNIRSGGAEQKRRALSLHKMANVPLKACGFKEFQQFQDYLGPKNFCIRVFEKEAANNLVFKGVVNPRYRCKGPPVYLNIYWADGHFFLIRSLNGFFGRSYWCDSCEIVYNAKKDHRNNCPARTICSGCERANCKLTEWKLCTIEVSGRGKDTVYNGCGRMFQSQECFDRHKAVIPTVVALGENGQPTERRAEYSLCDRVKKCGACGRICDERQTNGVPLARHNCNIKYCYTCKKFNNDVREQHVCYMQRLDKPKKKENQFAKVFIFFDFECKQDVEKCKDKWGNSVYTHQPIMCVIQKVCEYCMPRGEHQTLRGCLDCGQNQVVFKGDTTLDKTGAYLFSEDHNKRNALICAHNARSYDFQFLVQYLIANGIQPSVIMNGHKIISMRVGRIQCLDSLSFLPFPLSKLPDCFNFTSLKKGFFPFLFYPKEGLDYIGEWPAMHYYNPDGMKENTRQSFLEWYPKQIHKVFNYSVEMEEYCVSDVQIL